MTQVTLWMKNQMKISPPSSAENRNTIKMLSSKLMERITDLLDYFEIEHEVYDNRIAFACPIHGGDNPNALTIFTTGDHSVGNWRCWTHQCEQECKQDILGFVQGVLSIQSEEDVGFGHTLKFVNNFLGSPSTDYVPEVDSKQNFVDLANKIFSKEVKKHSGVDPEEIRKRIQIPAQYYVGRGFLPETLEKFDVGLCTARGKPMSGRVVVPVYDENKASMIGCVGRSVNETLMPKWLNSKGFNSGASLYNYWHAKNHISETNTVILVEGQGDVWRLDEAGIYNVVGMFGCSLGEQQRIILERSGALNLVVMTDADEAGQKAKEKISQQCDRMYNVKFVDLPQKDVGDMSVEEINTHIKPQLGI